MALVNPASALHHPCFPRPFGEVKTAANRRALPLYAACGNLSRAVTFPSTRHLSRGPAALKGLNC